jgi:hypothetical protein
MTNPLQREVFLSGEGDAWFQRNRCNQSLADPAGEPLLPLLLELPLEAGSGTTVVKVGCGQGWRASPELGESKRLGDLRLRSQHPGCRRSRAAWC